MSGSLQLAARTAKSALEQAGRQLGFHHLSMTNRIPLLQLLMLRPCRQVMPPRLTQ
jgi:hypothetical protein